MFCRSKKKKNNHNVLLLTPFIRNLTIWDLSFNSQPQKLADLARKVRKDWSSLVRTKMLVCPYLVNIRFNTPHTQD